MEYATAKSQERSMDDILASIRKVIAEDMNQEQETGVAGDVTSKVIELTQMVQDDGSVIDINSYQNKNKEVLPMDRSSSPSPQVSAPLEGVPTQAGQEAIDSFFDTPTPEAQAMSHQAPQPDTSVEGGALSLEAQPPLSIDRLVSEAVVKESLAAFSRLTDVVHNHPDLSGNLTTSSTQAMGGKTLEALMRELLIPLLRDWLDSNLPSLVKWIIAEEIQKILKQSK
jgi:cell pole-organizing protein PopZ